MKLADLLDDKEEFTRVVKQRLDSKALTAVSELKRDMAQEFLQNQEEIDNES